MASMTPAQFVKKWSKIQLKERTNAQSHFNDVCALVDHKTPLEVDPKGEFFTFEADAEKLEGERGWTSPCWMSTAGRTICPMRAYWNGYWR